jgi:hypothetical protein
VVVQSYIPVKVQEHPSSSPSCQPLASSVFVIVATLAGGIGVTLLLYLHLADDY